MKNRSPIVMYLLLLLVGMAVAVAAQEGTGGADVSVDSVFTGEPPLVDTIATPAPPTNVSAVDAPDDHGHAVVVTWDLSADDGSGAESVLSYELFLWKPFLVDTIAALRAELESLDNEAVEGGSEGLADRQERTRDEFDSGIDRLSAAYEAYPEGGEFRALDGAVAPAGTTEIAHTGKKDEYDANYLPDHTDLYYRVDAVTANPEIRASSEVIGPVQSRGQWYNSGRSPVLVSVIIFGLLIVMFVRRARSGESLYVRPLAGIEAVDDAIGRATEMGRPILYVLGLGTAADVATIASFTVLNRVAKRVAEYQTSLNVPTYDPIVMSVAQEVVKSAYLDAGRPDDYHENIVHFVTQSQFAYVAAVNGIMVRERPATNVYMGKFFAESLILAETGSLAGSIQIAGTDEIAQIPFFIVACDYTLIGEELYAASAYLGREPILLGSLKAQDYMKAAVIVFAIAGLVLNDFGMTWFSQLFYVSN